jgi:hypothetical protein
MKVKNFIVEKSSTTSRWRRKDLHYLFLLIGIAVVATLPSQIRKVPDYNRVHAYSRKHNILSILEE